MSQRRYTYLVKEDILLLKRRYTAFWRKAHRTFVQSGMGGLMLLSLWLTACVGEELQKPLLGEGEGYLRLQIAPVSAEISTSPLTKAEIPIEQIPKPNQCAIKITNKSTGDSTTYENSAALPNPLVLKAGVTYTVEAYYGTDSTLQVKPYFHGSSEVTIQPNQNNDATINVVFANAMLEPVVDNDLKKHYSEWTLSVKAGSASQPLASNSMERNLYVQSGLPIEITFSGTNLINGLTSKTAKVTDAAQPRTQYTIQCNPENLPEFTLATTATATHTLPEGYLNGTEVALNVTSLTGTPDKLIREWDATLKNADGTIVRTYRANGAPTQGSSQIMNVEGNWPYLPQGNYTLSAKLTLMTDETVEATETTVTVRPPTFSVSASAYTSYNKYTNEEIDAANQCDGSTIYNMQAVPTIAPELLANTNYTQSSDLKLDGKSVLAGDIGSQTWGAHTLVASYTFDGATYNGNATYHVTGLPYRGNYSSTSPIFGNGEIDKWLRIGTSSENKGQYGYILLYYYFKLHNNCYVFSPAFQLPQSTNVTYSTKVAYFTGGLGNPTIDVYVGSSIDTSGKVKDKTVSIKRINSNLYPDDSKFTTITTEAVLSNNYRICISHNEQQDKNGAEVYLTFKNLEVIYR